MKSAAGFSLVEVLVASALVLALVGSAVALLATDTSLSRVHAPALDQAQRARAALETLRADLLVAGAGSDHAAGPSSLTCCVPPVVPRRIGLRHPDPPGLARRDALTIVYAAPAAVAARLAGAILPGAPLWLASSPQCGTAPLCGMSDNQTLLFFDRLGDHDYYRLSAPAGGPPTVALRQATAALPLTAGLAVMPVESHTYYFDSSRRQLRHDDGYRSDVAIVDNVVDVAFTYFGSAAPPTYPRPPLGTSNCLYDASWVRANPPGYLSSPSDLVELPIAILQNGPWCGTGDNRFDLDLLRIRRVRAELRLQAVDDLRDSSSVFRVSGVSRSAQRLVPDLTVVVDVAPRNLHAFP